MFSLVSAICVMFVMMSVHTPVTSLKHKNFICEVIHDCICGFPSGQGINLTNLATKTLMFNDTKRNLTFYFNPCDDALNCSAGSLLCVHDQNMNKTTDLGLKGESTFLSEGLSSSVFLNLHNGDIETEVQLECSSSTETNLSLKGINDKDFDPVVKYTFLLASPEACLKPVDLLYNTASSGSVFVIVLLVLFLAYFIVGMAANHFLQGASGWEMIPNYHFWRSICNGLMDGVRFIANGCRPPPSYEQI